MNSLKNPEYYKTFAVRIRSRSCKSEFSYFCRVDRPFARPVPHGSGHAAFLHPALCKADTSHRHPYILT